MNKIKSKIHPAGNMKKKARVGMETRVNTNINQNTAQIR